MGTKNLEITIRINLLFKITKRFNKKVITIITFFINKNFVRDLITLF